jgi:hypothetical protein
VVKIFLVFLSAETRNIRITPEGREVVMGSDVGL